MIIMCVMDITTISIRNQTKERLKRFGKFGESFDEVISRILFLMEEKNE